MLTKKSTFSTSRLQECQHQCCFLKTILGVERSSNAPFSSDQWLGYTMPLSVGRVPGPRYRKEEGRDIEGTKIWLAASFNPFMPYPINAKEILEILSSGSKNIFIPYLRC